MTGTKRTVAEAALKVVQIDKIQFDPSYQRDVVPGHKKIVTNFNIHALGIPLVAERDDGTLWCVDGRQRVTALGVLGKKTVRAEVFASRGPEHEAEVFKLVNKNRTGLKPLQLYQAMLTAHDHDAWEVKKIVESYGFKIPREYGAKKLTSPEDASKMVLAVNSVMRIYKDGGEDVTQFVFSVLKEVWEGDLSRLKDGIMLGLYTFYNRREGTVDTEKLVSRLSATTAAKVLYSAQLGVGSRESCVADVIERVYKSRKKQ